MFDNVETCYLGYLLSAMEESFKRLEEIILGLKNKYKDMTPEVGKKYDELFNEISKGYRNRLF